MIDSKQTISCTCEHAQKVITATCQATAGESLKKRQGGRQSEAVIHMIKQQ